MSFRSGKSALYRENTPLEEYAVGGRRVFVKRDDLYGIRPAPPLGKLRGLRRILQREYEQGSRLVGCWDTHVSKLGLGVAAECRSYEGFGCLLVYSASEHAPVPPHVAEAANLGADILRIRPNHVDICFAQARKLVAARNGLMLPFGLECEDSVRAIAAEASRVPRECSEAGTVVLCCGSGVTLSGLLTGLRGRPARVIGVSSGRSVKRIARCIQTYVSDMPSSVELVEPLMPYADVPDTRCPFPVHPNYDLKAWKYLTERIGSFGDGPILFWNIGA